MVRTRVFTALNNRVIDPRIDSALASYEFIDLLTQDMPDAHGETSHAFVDWLLPDMSGLEMVRRLRATPQGRVLRITMLLDDTDAEDRRRALRAGADDYMPEGADAAAMIARIEQAGLRGGAEQHRIVARDFVVDEQTRLVRYRGTPIRVHPTQFALLIHFLENADRVLTRTDLINALERDEGAVGERTVDKWIARLRSSLDEVGAAGMLRTVHNQGYVLDLE
jgi:two-component system phosphate regulon response regulator PhoB